MDKAEITKQLNDKYNEIFPKYWHVIIKKIEEPKNSEIIKIYDYLDSNIKYLETYLSLIEIENKEEMKYALEKNNFIKELTDVLYEPKEQTQIHYNPKIEEFNE